MLEEAEATSGLEPPAAADGQAGNACINGRRVEVLSRTISVVKKLLHDRRDSALASPPPNPTLLLLGDPDSSSSACLEGDSSHVSDCSLVASDALAAATTTAAVPPACSPPAEAVATPLQAAGVATDSAAPPTMHMAMPLHGAHPSMVVSPGFAGMPGAAMSAAAAAAAGMHHHHHGAPGQPIFIAVPMYMPGQGVGGGVESAAASHVSMPPVPPVLAGAATSASPAVVAPGGPVKPSGAGVGKEAWALPPGMGLQSMMTLQMPHFVTQALSTEEGDEKPTHAVCA